MAKDELCKTRRRRMSLESKACREDIVEIMEKLEKTGAEAQRILWILWGNERIMRAGSASRLWRNVRNGEERHDNRDYTKRTKYETK